MIFIDLKKGHRKVLSPSPFLPSSLSAFGSVQVRMPEKMEKNEVTANDDFIALVSKPNPEPPYSLSPEITKSCLSQSEPKLR